MDYTTSAPIGPGVIAVTTRPQARGRGGASGGRRGLFVAAALSRTALFWYAEAQPVWEVWAGNQTQPFQGRWIAVSKNKTQSKTLLRRWQNSAEVLFRHAFYFHASEIKDEEGGQASPSMDVSVLSAVFISSCLPEWKSEWNLFPKQPDSTKTSGPSFNRPCVFILRLDILKVSSNP